MTDYEDQFEPELATIKSSKRENEAEGQLTVDVFQDGDDIVIQSTIAGVSQEDIDISITNDMVTIKGRRTPDMKIRSDNYFYRELYWGPFSRSIILPEDIDADSAKASMRNGLLTIRMPKLDRVKTKKLRIEE
jgi:HSP20 family protein